MTWFDNKKIIRIFIADDFLLPDAIYTWLEQANYQPSLHKCHWQLLNDYYQTKGFSAALFAKYDEIITNKKDKFIMRADPVCLQADWHGLNIIDNHPLELNLADAKILSDEINQDLPNARLQIATPYHWYIIANKLPIFYSLPTDCAQGKYTHKAQHLPKEWIHYLNQIQINLHNHPLNQSRKNNKINSIWCWGVSKINQSKKSSNQSTVLYTDNLEIKIYAEAFNITQYCITKYQDDDNSIIILDKNCTNLDKITNLLTKNYLIQITYRGGLYSEK